MFSGTNLNSCSNLRSAKEIKIQSGTTGEDVILPKSHSTGH